MNHTQLAWAHHKFQFVEGFDQMAYCQWYESVGLAKTDQTILVFILNFFFIVSIFFGRNDVKFILNHNKLFDCAKDED